ncbi:MAG: transposase [Kiritimatiellia bacterium]
MRHDQRIRHLDKVIATAEKSCLETVERNGRMRVLRKRLVAVGGVGDIAAIIIRAGLPEIGCLADARLFRLAGIAPEERRSGTREWTRKIWDGRKDVRNAPYMSTLASIRWNAILGAYYRRKRDGGHPHNWTIIPTIRRMLPLLNRIARDPNFMPNPEPESTKRNTKASRKEKTA